MRADHVTAHAAHARRARLGFAIAFAALALLAPTRADAFCRTTTTPPPPDHGSVDGSWESMSACWTEGLPLYPPSQCLPYQLLANESPIIPNAILSDRLGRAFATWTAPNPTCTPGISGIELAPAAETQIVDYTMGQPNRNLVGVAPTWTHVGGADTLSLATLTFRANTGEVLDVDLEVNGTVPWAFDAPEAHQYDLEAVLTHEVGHMLGLAHSPVLDATMNPTYTPGSVEQRTLTSDDEAGICTVYPSRAERLAGSGLVPSTACNLAPGGPAGCGDPVITHGCATSPLPSRTSTQGLGIVLTLTLTLLATAGVVRRRRSN